MNNICDQNVVFFESQIRHERLTSLKCFQLLILSGRDLIDGRFPTVSCEFQSIFITIELSCCDILILMHPRWLADQIQ